MRWLLRLSFALTFLCALTSLVRAGNYANFKVAVYVRAYEVQKMKDPDWLKTNWGIVERQLRVDKVYLETHRDLLIIDDATLAQAKKFFLDKGIEVAGGIATVRNERNLFETFCYTKPDHRAKIQEIVEATARNFDEFLLDDFFFTSCKCDSCIAAKGDRSWTAFRLDLMTEVSRDLIVGAARKVNPRVKVTIKYPNWYEDYQATGYNLETEPQIFDRIYTGTETRDPVHTGQHLQPYHSYEAFRYLENIKPGGNGGGWVDTGARVTADRYAEQLWDTMFAKAPEIMLFALHELLQPILPSDRGAWQGQGTSFDYDQAVTPIPLPGGGTLQPTLARVANQALRSVDPVVGKLGKPIGLASYRPFHSTGEPYLHNFLGMAGIPIELYPEFPREAEMVLLAEDAKFDPNLVSKIKGQLNAGRKVVITSGLLQALQNHGIEQIAEIEYTDKKIIAQEFGAWRSFEKAPTPILLPQILYRNNDSWELISAQASGIGHPLLLQNAYAKGTLYVLTIPDNFGDLYALPTNTLNRIRDILTRGLPARLEGPAQIALFPYDNGALLVQSFRDQPETVSLVTESAALTDLLSGEKLASADRPKAHAFTFTLKPHSFRLFSTRAP